MLDRNTGHIVCISSMAGLCGGAERAECPSRQSIVPRVDLRNKQVGAPVRGFADVVPLRVQSADRPHVTCPVHGFANVEPRCGCGSQQCDVRNYIWGWDVVITR